MNDGSTAKPYFMSKGLMKVVGKKNEKLTDPSDNKKNKANHKKKGKTEPINDDNKVKPTESKRGPPPIPPSQKGKWA